MIGPRAALNVDWAGADKNGPPYALYFFKDREYIRWDIDGECLFDGYPKPIDEGWPGLLDAFPETPLAGAIHVPAWRNRIVFFFKGKSDAVTWDVGNHQRDPDLTPISAILPSRLTEDGPFAPIYVDRGTHQSVYVFRGDEYSRFTVSGEAYPAAEDNDYPNKIGGGWTGGLSVAPVCGVSVNWTRRSKALPSNKLYFFLGDLYTRWDLTSHTNNYRLDIPSGWNGWPDFE